MLKSTLLKPPIRLIAVDIDGTLLNSRFRISQADLAALRRAHDEGVEVVLATGRRHAFALPIAQQLGFDFYLISSNGAITRSLKGDTFHRHMMPSDTCRRLCAAMKEFRGHLVLTFDTELKGAIVLERMDLLTDSIQKWLEKNLEFIDFVIPLEDSLVTDPVQAMFCGSISRMQQALAAIAASGLSPEITVLRTEYPARDLSIVDILNVTCSKGHAVERWANHLGVAREEIMAIGDNFNDIEMLVLAGRPFIMGNASQELRGRGWAVTLSNDESGVAAAVEQVLGVSRVSV
jgi:Cof subfamily protein (haloacid dehalogenase superfamily)